MMQDKGSCSYLCVRACQAGQPIHKLSWNRASLLRVWEALWLAVRSTRPRRVIFFSYRTSRSGANIPGRPSAWAVVQGQGSGGPSSHETLGFYDRGAAYALDL